ncbi:hypothetical protein quinque_011921 [Culex quinquefasciatus]|uniref:putative odorant receptor 85d n=1 Tax=Culex quinquefasciatus TaxID=7176 RepID=UPI0018E2EBC8|nr:putative odorant receptor 85d [Culex quinquefasciatus]
MSPAIPPDLQVLKFPLRMLRFVGLWGDRRELVRYASVVLCMSVVLIIPKAALGSGKDGFDSFARNTAELIFFTEVCVSIGIFASRRGSFERLVEVLRETVLMYEDVELLGEIAAFNRKMERFSKSYAAWIGFWVVLYLGIPMIFTCVKVVFPGEGDRGDFMLIAELQFYWLDIRRNLLDYAIYLVFCSMAIFCSSYQSTLKGAVILVSIQYGTKLFELVAMSIDRLGNVKEEIARKNQLREIVNLHKLAFQYTKHLEDTVCFMMINQILNCILIWCLMMFYVSTNFGPNAVCVIILFAVLMGEMIAYCVNGSKLAETAAAVGHAVYRYPWYNEPTAMQKDMQLIIERAQKPTGITAAKFYFVNIERLGLVVQASYSYYLILKKRF